MKREEEKIKKILQLGMQEPTSDFSTRVMQQIIKKETVSQVQPYAKALQPMVFIFGLIALLAIAISLVIENDFLFLQKALVPSLSIRQMINIILSLISFWVWILLSPWIKKRFSIP